MHQESNLFPSHEKKKKNTYTQRRVKKKKKLKKIIFVSMETPSPINVSVDQGLGRFDHWSHTHIFLFIFFYWPWCHRCSSLQVVTVEWHKSPPLLFLTPPFLLESCPEHLGGRLAVKMHIHEAGRETDGKATRGRERRHGETRTSEM